MSQAEYVTDVPYVRAYENDLSPARLRLAAALNGFTPPPADAFTYAELGSAHGDTIAALAASYPRATFVGIDINPDHIASAERLASRGGLTNVRFLERDFESLAKDELPELDFVTAHGVWSWVGPTKRKAIVDLAAAKLKPGGLLHVSYNALPGWAAVEPLRQIIAGRAAIAQGDSVARAREGVLLAEKMSELGAEYFAATPAAKAMLAKIAKLGLPYVVHEYLHAHWAPMYFAQVAAEMAAAGLFFVGQLPLYLNYRDLAIPAALAPLFAGTLDRGAFESLKDFALNEYFRRDVFIKGRATPTEEATRAYLDATPFGPLLDGGPTPRQARLPHHALDYAGPIFDALLPALDRRGGRPRELGSRPELSLFDVARVRDAIHRLALGEVIVPLVDGGVPSPPAGPSERYHLPLRYNRAVLEDGLSRDLPVTLASVAAGTGVELTPVEAVALFVLTTVAPSERRAWIRSRCERASFRLTVHGRPVEGTDEQCRTLLEEIAAFEGKRVPRLLSLGVLAPA